MGIALKFLIALLTGRFRSPTAEVKGDTDASEALVQGVSASHTFFTTRSFCHRSRVPREARHSGKLTGGAGAMDSDRRVAP
ncbi:hypothetical protein LCGC14_0768690 [marine sediment metagenome]|uniref:Uncharacterized protein n=1 Tax=marine sediment metagenome TaxID=412755 RepID=A0A0F9SJ27_9ZZZZ